jgi:hypothetical protein
VRLKRDKWWVAKGTSSRSYLVTRFVCFADWMKKLKNIEFFPHPYSLLVHNLQAFERYSLHIGSNCLPYYKEEGNHA